MHRLVTCWFGYSCGLAHTLRVRIIVFAVAFTIRHVLYVESISLAHLEHNYLMDARRGTYTVTVKSCSSQALEVLTFYVRACVHVVILVVACTILRFERSRAAGGWIRYMSEL